MKENTPLEVFDYCDYCGYLEPKEWEQSRSKEPHICKLLDKQLFHKGKHPKIPTPHDCPINLIAIKLLEGL